MSILSQLDRVDFTLLNTASVDLDQGWNYDNVISPFARLYLITAGAATVYHHQQVFQLRPGHLYLIPSYTYSRYVCENYHHQYYISMLEAMGEGISVFDIFSFRYEVPALPEDQLLFDRLLSLNPDRAIKNNDPKIYDNLPTLRWFKSRNQALSYSAYLETKGILQILFSRFILTKRSPVNEVSGPTHYISDTLRYIRLHLQEPLSIAELAQRVHLHPDYFSRLFKEVTGLRPLKFIQTRRIERAQLLLATTHDSLETIAQKVGLMNPSYFSRLFKAFTQQTPGEYRKGVWKV